MTTDRSDDAPVLIPYRPAGQANSAHLTPPKCVAALRASIQAWCITNPAQNVVIGNLDLQYLGGRKSRGTFAALHHMAAREVGRGSGPHFSPRILPHDAANDKNGRHLWPHSAGGTWK